MPARLDVDELVRALWKQGRVYKGFILVSFDVSSISQLIRVVDSIKDKAIALRVHTR